jgi:glycosyltransferase involved in cell wall biosynthesis
VISNWLKYKIESLSAPIDTLIFNGIDFNEFYPDKKAKLTNEIRILMPYRPAKWKGVKDGLKAFELVKNKRKNVKLILYGPEPNIKLPDFVEFHLHPLSGELRELYNSCDIFLFPSHFEGFGLPPMEAMACKIPIVTTNVGAIPDCTIPGKTALVSDPHSPQDLAENLIKLIDDENLRSNIGEAGYEYIQQFNWESSKNKLEKLFKDTLRSNNK